MNYKLKFRKRVRIGKNKPAKEAFLCEIKDDKVAFECYDCFDHETILKCEISINQLIHTFEFLVESVSGEGLSLFMYGRVVKNQDIIKRFYRDKLNEQKFKIPPKKKRWIFW